MRSPPVGHYAPKYDYVIQGMPKLSFSKGKTAQMITRNNGQIIKSSNNNFQNSNINFNNFQRLEAAISFKNMSGRKPFLTQMSDSCAPLEIPKISTKFKNQYVCDFEKKCGNNHNHFQIYVCPPPKSSDKIILNEKIQTYVNYNSFHQESSKLQRRQYESTINKDNISSYFAKNNPLSKCKKFESYKSRSKETDIFQCYMTNIFNRISLTTLTKEMIKSNNFSKVDFTNPSSIFGNLNTLRTKNSDDSSNNKFPKKQKKLGLESYGIDIYKIQNLSERKREILLDE